MFLSPLFEAAPRPRFAKKAAKNCKRNDFDPQNLRRSQVVVRKAEVLSKPRKPRFCR